MKKLRFNREMCHKSLDGAVYLLDECRCADYISGKFLDYITVALMNIRIVLRRTPLVDYPYKDILENELSYFKKKKVTYIDGHDGTMKSKNFKDVIKPNEYIENYRIGNRAIGQVFVGDTEIYDEDIAIQHSLRSTVDRWYTEAMKLSEICDEVIEK